MIMLRFVFALALMVAVAPAASQAACLVQPYQASFEVKAIGIDTGHSHEKTTRTGDRFEMVTQADAHVLFYHRNEVEKSSGVVDGMRLEPEVYSWKTVGGSSGKVNVKKGHLDTLTVGLQLRVDLSRGKLPKSVKVTDGTADARSATVELLPGKQKLTTKIGDFEVQVVKLTGLPLIRELWFDTADSHRLVRIVVHDTAVGKVEITISEYKDLASACVVES
jgi:hypothetical protein